MKSVILEKFGEPSEVLSVREEPVPKPARGEVRVRMLASPINPSDLMMIRGVYGKLPKLPSSPGFEGVGIVEENGGGIFGKFLLGKRVAVLNGETGNWREHTVLPARQAVPLPKNLPVDQAAMFFVNPATAYIMTREVLKVPQGEWLLQSAAGSALGKMVIRLGKKFGFKTLNIVRRPEQAAELQQLGATKVIVSSSDDFVDQVKSITQGHGVQHAIDPVGGRTGSAMIRCLGYGGRLLVYGTLSGEPLNFSPRELMTPGTSVEGFWLARFMAKLSILRKLGLIRKVSSLMQEGLLTADVAEQFPLSRIRDAVIAAETPARSGKVLLRIDEA